MEEAKYKTPKKQKGTGNNMNDDEGQNEEKKGDIFKTEKDTVKLLPLTSKSGYKVALDNGTCSLTCHHFAMCTQLHLHVRLLYTLVIGLLIICLCSVGFAIVQIQSLRSDLDMLSQSFYSSKLHDNINQNNSGIQSHGKAIYPDSKHGYGYRFASNSNAHLSDSGDDSELESERKNKKQSDIVSGWDSTVEPSDSFSNEVRHGESSDGRTKRSVTIRKGADSYNDWAWMSTHVRVPIPVLTAYCKQTRTYCNANGPPGMPGAPGLKGEKGNSGETVLKYRRASHGSPGKKGEPGEPGPRGPKGDEGRPGRNGLDGSTGPIGSKGDTGERGIKGPAGIPGLRGFKGERGHKGQKGQMGKGGFPGINGERGEVGSMGPRGLSGLKGDRGDTGAPGYCEAHHCVDIEMPTKSPEPTVKPTLPPRKLECLVKIIGKPVYISQREGHKHGAWMTDTSSSDGKVWVTQDLNGTQVFEYPSEADFRLNQSAVIRNLDGTPFFGTGQKVHNGYLYYHWQGQPKIVRFDLVREEIRAVQDLPDFAPPPVVSTQNSSFSGSDFLYTSQSAFVDFHFDRHGLWALYVQNSTQRVVVSLLDTETLRVKTTVTLQDFYPGSKGGAFIVCGNIYTLRHHDRGRSWMDGVRDIWSGGYLEEITLNVGVPYKSISMISFDYNQKQILAWDTVNQLKYPLLLT